MLKSKKIRATFNNTRWIHINKTRFCKFSKPTFLLYKWTISLSGNVTLTFIFIWRLFLFCNIVLISAIIHKLTKVVVILIIMHHRLNINKYLISCRT